MSSEDSVGYYQDRVFKKSGGQGVVSSVESLLLLHAGEMRNSVLAW